MLLSDKKKDYQNTTSQKPWWNQPLWGDRSFLEKVKSHFAKTPIPESTVSWHDLALQEITQLGSLLEQIDSQEFTDPEFILLLKIRLQLHKGIEGYQGLAEKAQMLNVAIEAKDSFLRIEATEFQYRGYAQQEFYQGVFNILTQQLSTDNFINEVKKLLATSQQRLKTEQGQKALNSYFQDLEHLAATHELGLELLYLFKKYDFSDFSTIRTIDALVQYMQSLNLQEQDRLVRVIKNNTPVFEKLSHIIGLNEEHQNIETYTKLMQYVALMDKHKETYKRFEKILSQLIVWEKVYYTLTNIRKEYPSKNYQLPKTFREPLPALNVYQKYQPWLVIQKTSFIRGKTVTYTK